MLLQNRSRRMWVFLAVAGLCLLVLLGVGVYFFLDKLGQVSAENSDKTSKLSGQVALEVRALGQKTHTVQTLYEREVLGWSWLVAPLQWQFDCRAQESVQGIQLDAVWLRDQCEQDHELGYHLLRQLLAVLATRLASTRRQLLDLYR